MFGIAVELAGLPLALQPPVSGSPATELEVLGPLREDERELDELLARAREGAARAIAAAEAHAHVLRDAARTALAAELRALGDTRARLWVRIVTTAGAAILTMSA